MARGVVDEGECLGKKGCAVQREKSGCEDVDDQAKVLVRRRGVGEKDAASARRTRRRREEKSGHEDVDNPS